MMNTSRAKEWSEELKGSFVGMQGAQATYDPSKGERAVQLWSIDHHDVWEAKQIKKMGAGCQPEGVAIFCPEGDAADCEGSVCSAEARDQESSYRCSFQLWFV